MSTPEGGITVSRKLEREISLLPNMNLAQLQAGTQFALFEQIFRLFLPKKS
jgi:hypothetical protein